MIHFESAFAYDVRKGPNFILSSFVYKYPVDPAHTKETMPFLIYLCVILLSYIYTHGIFQDISLLL